MTWGYARRPACPDSVFGWHSPADDQGRCTWCGFKYTSRKTWLPERIESELVRAYRRTYDPDYDP